MKPNVYIRADGNPEIGLGHVVRCMALGQALKSDFMVTFFCRQLPDKLKAEMIENKFDIRVIADEDEFSATINENDIVVLDGYHFTSGYQKKIKSAGATLVFIDDLHDAFYYADLIINHAPGVDPRDYSAQLYTQFALGTEFTLLRSSFLERIRERKDKPAKIETIIICFGGADFKNLTESTLSVVCGFSEFRKIIVVTGSAYQDIKSLQHVLNGDGRIEHHHAIDEKAMADKLGEADLAIVPASGILLEALALGCTVISGMYADNQKFVYENYLNTGAFIDAKDFSNRQLTTAIGESLHGKTQIHRLIDGRSGARLLKIFYQLAVSNHVQVRMATQSDVELTYQWAKDPQVRAFSFSQDQISRSEHTSWFQNKLMQEHCVYFIALLDLQPIGSIRFDCKQSEAVISYLLGPEYHGKGLGVLILKKALEKIIENKLNLKKGFDRVTGYVMKANAPSIKAFERLGFTKYEDGDIFKFQKIIQCERVLK